ILEKIIIELEEEVLSLLEKEKENLEIIESLKSKGSELSENAISDSKNQSENDCHEVEKGCDNLENSNVIAPGMFKINVSQSVSPISAYKPSCASNNVENKTKRKRRKRTSYNVLKETHETFCENLEKENNDLKMHYKRLFDSIKQKKVVSQVFTKSIPKVNVSEKIYTGKSSKPISRNVSQFTTYSLQKDRKYLKKQHSFETFASQNHEKNKSSKQIWKRKGENISKRFKYSRDEMFSMRKLDDSVLKKVKDVRFPFILKRIFQNETPSFNKWKSSSSSKVKTSNETPGFRTVFTPLRNFKTPNETSRFYKSNWINEKSFKSPLISRKLFQNETPGFKSPWNSTSMHQIDATYIWFSKYGKPVSNVLKWVPKVVA
ncbi:hypothetical protein Tco_0354968, partial [Tanacetum coccineum]